MFIKCLLCDKNFLGTGGTAGTKTKPPSPRTSCLPDRSRQHTNKQIMSTSNKCCEESWVRVRGQRMKTKETKYEEKSKRKV